MVYEMSDIFSFFLPSYSAPGVISTAALKSPEGTLMHKKVGLINGMLSLVKFG